MNGVDREPPRRWSLPPELRSPTVWIASLAVWTVVALLAASIRYFYYSPHGGLTFGQSFVYSMSDEIYWMLFTPPLLAIGRRFRIDRRTWTRHVPVLAGVSLVVPLIYWFPAAASTGVAAKLFGHSGWQWEVTRVELLGSYLNNLLLTWEVLVVSQAVIYYREYRTRELRDAQLQAQLARAQLQTLRAQLQPHFLFNTLHAISTLMHRDVDAADRMVALLSDMLRHSLEDDGAPEVPLRRELASLDRYLEIEKVRFQDRLCVSVEVPPDTLDVLVPSFLLQPIVENAVLHGIARCPGPGRLGVRARRDGGRLELTVWDTGPGLGGVPATPGIGLAHTRARLRQLYGEDHVFAIDPGASGGLEVKMAVPAREAEGRAAEA